MLPRWRDWRFSSARPGSEPSKAPASISSMAAWAGSMGMERYSMPRFAASSAASSRLWSLEKRLGMETPVTFSGPRASTATAATTLESMPPDRPM